MLRVATCSYIQYLVDSELWPRNPYVATHYDSPASHVYKRLHEGLQTSFDLVQSFIQVLLPHSPPLRRLLDLRTPECPAQNLKTLQTLGRHSRLGVLRVGQWERRLAMHEAQGM